jgi:hypothetical protein
MVTDEIYKKGSQVSHWTWHKICIRHTNRKLFSNYLCTDSEIMMLLLTNMAPNFFIAVPPRQSEGKNAND